MKKISIQLTLEELSTLNDALRYTHPFAAGRRRRVYEKLRQGLRAGSGGDAEPRQTGLDLCRNDGIGCISMRLVLKYNLFEAKIDAKTAVETRKMNKIHP